MARKSSTKRPARLQVEVPQELRHAFKVKATSDGESMSAAAHRLLTLYTAGKLPNAEPKQDHP